MSVRYKFKNTTQYDTIIFAGPSISLCDFKNQVIKQKHLTTDDDLRVVVADTKEEYKNVDDQIPRNTSLIISRIPRTPGSKKGNASKRVLASKTNCINVEKPKINNDVKETLIDLSKLNISEDKKIEVMMKQSTSFYSPSKYAMGPFTLPVNYRCKKCHVPGHWIKDCPIVVPKPPRGRAGIPKSFIVESQNKENEYPETQRSNQKISDVPSDLLCPICGQCFVEAVMISCCGKTYCENCIRNKLLESRNSECPDCLEIDIDLESLIPNRYVRKAVNAFNSERKLSEASVKHKK